MLKLQELKRSLFGPNPKKDNSFLRCGYLCLETQETISVHKMALKRLPFISQLFNGSVGRNCSSSCLPQGAHMPKGLETKLEFLFIITWIFRLLLKISVEGIFCEWSVFLGTLLTAELHWNFKSRVNLTVYQHAVEGNAAGQLSLLSAFAVPVSCLHIYLASVERQSFFICDGIQTLDMISLGLGPTKIASAPEGLSARLMHFEFEHFYWLCKPASTKCIGGIVASIAAFQAVDRLRFPANYSIRLGLKSILNSFCDIWLRQKLLDGLFDSRKGLALPVWETNPGLPRDRRRYCPLY